MAHREIATYHEWAGDHSGQEAFGDPRLEFLIDTILPRVILHAHLYPRSVHSWKALMQPAIDGKQREHEGDKSSSVLLNS